MREETQNAWRFFLEGRRYTVENLEQDYLAEVADYNINRWASPQRAARLSAAVKRYKTSEMLNFIFTNIACDIDLDLTPLAVKRLCYALFGRKGSQALIVDVFGKKGRHHRSIDSNQKNIEEIAAKYRYDSRLYWVETLAEIKRIKLMYQAAIKTIKE